jgi:hypothetical protein
LQHRNLTTGEVIEIHKLQMKSAGKKMAERDPRHFKEEDAPVKGVAPSQSSPLLTLFSAASLEQAKKRGFVTFDQLNEVLPLDTTSPEQIEEIMSMLWDVGINVREDEDTSTYREPFSQNKTPSPEAMDLVAKIRSCFSNSLPFEKYNELVDAVPLGDEEYLEQEILKSGLLITGCAWTTLGKNVSVSIKSARLGPFVLTKLLNEKAIPPFLAAWLPLRANDAVWAFSSVSHGRLHGHSGIALVRAEVLIDAAILIEA